VLPRTSLAVEDSTSVSADPRVTTETPSPILLLDLTISADYVSIYADT